MKEFENGGINNNTYEILFKDKNTSIKQSKEMYNILRKMEEILSDYSFKNIKCSLEFKNTTYEFKSFSAVTKENLKNSSLDVRISCHHYSFEYVFKYPEAKIATGFITVNDKRMLHSFLLYKESDIEYIIDITRNLFIKKSLYEKITNFEILTIIDANTLKEDCELLNNFYLLKFGLTLKTYFAFRDEIIKDLSKNSFILKNKL